MTELRYKPERLVDDPVDIANLCPGYGSHDECPGSARTPEGVRVLCNCLCHADLSKFAGVPTDLEEQEPPPAAESHA